MSESLKKLKDFTTARVALGRSGHSIPSKAHLKFRLDHAEAKDAVHLPIDYSKIEEFLAKEGVDFVTLTSKAGTREVYLQRPDLGREVDTRSKEILSDIKKPDSGCDIALVIEDGLSAKAIHEQAIPFLQALLPLLSVSGTKIRPVALVHQGRVAIGDEIGKLMKAKLVAVLVGERPGLTVPNSLGVYLTYDPKPGLTDESRNCISNIHKEGLSHSLAAAKLKYLIDQSMSLKLSGVGLKENFDSGNIIS